MSEYAMKNGMVFMQEVIANIDEGRRYIHGHLSAVTDGGDYIIETDHNHAVYLKGDHADLVAIEDEEKRKYRHKNKRELI